MEFNGKNEYIPKVNLSLRSKMNQNILREEAIRTPKNNYLKCVNTYRNNKNKRKESNNSINNDFDKLELLNKNKRTQNCSRKLNLINIKKNNSLNIQNKINDSNKEKKENLSNTIDFQKSEYNELLQNQKGINSDYENNLPKKDKKISNNKSYLMKEDDNLVNINENNSIFNQIISRFKKFNENYQKFIKHTTESNMFNYNLRTNSINKSIDIITNKNNSKIKNDEKSNNDRAKLIKVNHMKKNKINQIKNNFLVNKPINKNIFRNKNEIKKKENTSFNNRLKENLLLNNEFIINKIDNRRNVKNKYSKSKGKNIIHSKNNSTVDYITNKNKTINYIPIDFRINSEKREFRTNRIFTKNNMKRHTEYTKLEMIPNPTKINMINNQLIDKTKSIQKMPTISNKDKENIYTRININNNNILKKINKQKEKKINENLYLNTIDIPQKKENSFFYNTNLWLNNKYLKDLNINSEYENSLLNTIYQMQSTYTEKDSNKVFKINEKKKNDIENRDNKKAEYIKINDNQNIKDSFEHNNSFFDRNQNKTQSNIVQKMSLYIKPIKSKSKSKNENSRINFSKEKLLYTKKNNIVNLTTTHLSKLNKSIEENKIIFKNNKNNYIRQPILKKIYINDDVKKNLTIDINKTINRNNDFISLQNTSDSYYIIEKKLSLARFKKFYNFYFKIPIKNVCFLQKIRIHKPNNINNKYNGDEKITNKGRNQRIELIKNGKEDIRDKNISNSYSKNINKLNLDNKYENNIIFHSKNLSNNNLNIENKEKKIKRRAITEEKFVLGCSKLNKILSKNLKINHILNGLEIDILKTQMKLNSTDIDNQKRDSYNSNNDEKENGGSEKRYKINFSLKKISDNPNLIPNNNWYYELKENLDKKEILNESNNHFNFDKNDITNNYVPKSSRTYENCYNINPIKKPKNKKKSNSSNKIKIEKDITENKNEIIMDKYIYEQINQDMDNYLKFLEKEPKENEEKENIDINYVYNWKTIDDLMSKGKTKLEDIIKIYLEICKNRKITKLDLPKFNKYIKTIIEYYITDFSRNQIEIVHLNMIELFKSIIEFISNYSDIFLELLGNLLFILLRNKLYFMKDLNSFTEKEKETQIYIAKIVKYSILASGKCFKQYHNDFKYTKLFNNNEIFVNYVTNEIPELKKK